MIDNVRSCVRDLMCEMVDQRTAEALIAEVDFSLPPDLLYRQTCGLVKGHLRSLLEFDGRGLS
jgi:hypothetical protein